MAWFDDPAQFYLAGIDETMPLSQGDIVLAPIATLILGTAESNVAAPLDIGESRTVTVWQAQSDKLPAAPSIAAEVRWSLAMVVPHRCALEKEWNEKVSLLLAGGNAPNVAQDIATADTSLDPFVSLAPIVSYSDALEERTARNIAIGNRLGNFPICSDTEMPRSYVDFNQITTVHYSVVPVRRRIRALSSKAVAHLGARLAQHFGFRDLSEFSELENAVGQKIEKITCIRGARRLSVHLILEDGSEIALEGNARESISAEVPVRPTRH